MERSPIKNLVYTFFHWFSVVALSAISFFVQYAFMTDTGESYSGFFFTGSIYSINYFMYFIGVVLFFAGFYMIWKKYLVVDWNGFHGKCLLWKVSYLLIATVALAAIFVVALLVMLCYTGLVIDITPVWATWGFVYFPVYVLLVAVIDWYISRKHKKKTEV